MAKVESFTLDHTKVKAPYVRLITQKATSFNLRSAFCTA
ncbi:S-ribosylhomocysteine lyase [Bacillus capparidis]|uniref:S-ribosylhomocysteine lyase n=1 Tax=Bacillus capparidis TaxID=1840411 RepID=A0ABS4CXA7_9BACI|nr:S-ribosylhomocysteine lyase LuxS involved in autoinducer biosynthesis [Bacillus capparidis]MED1096664.1 S-ribosylhomocysteine lyase [Bacillus capparidis]